MLAFEQAMKGERKYGADDSESVRDHRAYSTEDNGTNDTANPVKI